MTDIRIINKPVVTSFMTTVEIRLCKPVRIPEGIHDIYSWQKYFNDLKEKAKTPEHAHGYELCHSILKWAASCNAQVHKVTKANMLGNVIEFTFKFYKLEFLNDFQKDFYVCVM